MFWEDEITNNNENFEIFEVLLMILPSAQENSEFVAISCRFLGSNPNKFNFEGFFKLFVKLSLNKTGSLG